MNDFVYPAPACIAPVLWAYRQIKPPKQTRLFDIRPTPTAVAAHFICETARGTP